MPLLQSDEEKQLMDWVKQQNAENDPRGTVLAPTPPTPANPMLAKTDNGEGSAANPEPEERVRDANPGHNPEDLKGYVQAQKDQVDQYGPEQEKAVLDRISKDQGSVGNRLARTAAGFGDALMMNAGRPSPGFMNAIDAREARNDERDANAVPALQNLNLQNMGAKEKLEMQTNTTPMGKAAADFLRPVIKSAMPGISPKEVEKMLSNPAQAAALVGMPIAVLESKAKIAMAGAELGLKQQMANSTEAMQNEQLKLAKEKQQSSDLEALSKMPWYSRILHPHISEKLEEGSGLKQSDEEAISWAKDNPTDPRASKILKLHGL